MGRSMQWYVYLVAILSVAFLGQIAVELVGRPLRSVFSLRRRALERTHSFQNISLPISREFAISSWQIREYDHAVRNVRAAERIFSDLGAQFLALSESEPIIRILVALFGLDMVRAGHELVNVSAVYAIAKSDSDEIRHAIERALQATNTALASSRRLSGDDLIKIRPEPMYLPEAIYPRQRNRPIGQPRMAPLRVFPRAKVSSPAATSAKADRVREGPAASPDSLQRLHRSNPEKQPINTITSPLTSIGIDIGKEVFLDSATMQRARPH
jgi:hypothetical protein